MASSMFAAEATVTSAFLGTSMGCAAVAPCKARVTMGSYSRQELEKKPLSLLRALARQKGVKPSTRAGIIDGLLGSASLNYPASYTPAPSPYVSSPSTPAAGGALDSLSLGELRTLAKSYGIRGDTRKELIGLLTQAGYSASAPAPAAAPAAPAYTPAPAATASAGLPAALLERKSLAELRAMARIRGVRGDTKKELVKLLSAGSSSNGAASAPASYSSYSPASSNGASASQPNPAVERQLKIKSLSQLRAIAAIKGIRGTTKEELVRQLALLA